MIGSKIPTIRKKIILDAETNSFDLRKYQSVRRAAVHTLTAQKPWHYKQHYCVQMKRNDFISRTMR